MAKHKELAEEDRKELFAYFARKLEELKKKPSTKELSKIIRDLERDTYRLSNPIALEEIYLEAKAAERENEDHEQWHDDMNALVSEFN